MNFKLKSNNGKVKALLHTGKDFVASEISISSAQHIIDTSEIKESDKPGYPIHAGEWYFEGEPIETTTTASKKETQPYNNFSKRGKK